MLPVHNVIQMQLGILCSKGIVICWGNKALHVGLDTPSSFRRHSIVHIVIVLSKVRIRDVQIVRCLRDGVSHHFLTFSFMDTVENCLALKWILLQKLQFLLCQIHLFTGGDGGKHALLDAVELLRQSKLVCMRQIHDRVKALLPVRIDSIEAVKLLII